MPSQILTDLHTSVKPFRNIRTRPTYLTTERINKEDNFNPIPIDRVNKFFSINIKQTYKRYILLETIRQGLTI